MDIVELGMDVDGRPLKFTREEMQRFVKAGKDVDGAARGVEKSTAAMGRAMAMAAAGIAAAAAAALSLGTAVQQAREFGAAMGEASTLLQGTREEMALMETEARRLGVTFGTGAKAQVEAFYQAISAGAGSVEEATKTLEAANRLAIGGVTNVTTAVDILTTATNVYSDSGLTAEEASDALFVAMKAGKTTIDELSGSLGKVLPLASNLGVSFDETAATVAALTKGGIATAEAVTGLRAAMTAVLGPSKQAQDLAEALGINFSAAGLEALGFAGFMEEVVAKTGGSSEAMQTLFSSVEATTVALALSGSAGQSLGVILADMTNKAGATADAYEKMAATFDQRLNRAMSAIADISLTIGNLLLTVMVPALEAAAAVATFAAENLDVMALAVTSLAVTQLPALVLSLRAATAGLTIIQAQFIAGALAARGMAIAAGVARGALALLGGPIGIIAGVLTAGAGAWVLWGEKAGIGETAADEAKVAINLMNEALDDFSQVESPAAQGAALMNAEAYKKQAEAALAGADAEVKRNQAMLAAASTSGANGSSGSIKDMGDSASFAARRLADSQAVLDSLSTSISEANLRLDDLTLTLVDQTVPAVDKGKKGAAGLSDSLGKTGGAAKGAASAIKKVSGEAEAFEKAMRDAAFTAEDFGTSKAQVLISGVDSVADAWSQFVFEGFKDFKGFADQVLNTFGDMLKQMIALAARNQILIGLGFGGVAGTASSAGSVVGALGGGGGGFGGLGGIGGLLGAFQGAGGIGGIVSGIGSGLGGIFSGGGLGASFANLGGLVTGSVSGLGAIGAAIPALGLVLGGIALISGVFKKKKKLIDEGLDVIIDDINTTVNSFNIIKRSGLFGSSTDTNIFPLELDVQQPVIDAIDNLRNGLLAVASEINVGADSLAGFQSDFRVSFKGLDEAGRAEALQEALTELSDEMARQLLASAEGFDMANRFQTTTREFQTFGTVSGRGENRIEGFVTRTVEETIDTLESFESAFAKSGETATQTLERLSLSIRTFNAVADTLGLTMFDATIQGADLASGLMDLFGGVEAFAASTDFFFQNFVRESERIEIATRQVTARLADLGLSLPESRDEFRALVEAQDLSTEAGREMFAALVQLSGQMDFILPQFQELTTGIGALGAQVDAASSALIQSLNGQIQASAQAAREAEQSAATYRRLGESLRDAARSIGGQTTQQAAARFGDLFQSAITGNVDALGALGGAGSDLAGAAAQSARSRVELARVEANIRNRLSEAAAVSEAAATGADFQANLLNVNTALLETVRADLQNGNATIESLQAQEIALARIADEIAASAQLQVRFGQDANGQVVAGLVNNSGQVVAGLNATTARNLNALNANSSIVSGAIASATAAQVRAIDADRNGVVTALEAQNALTIAQSSSTVFAIASAVQRSGSLTVQELRAQLAGKASDVQLNRVIAAIDTNGDGVISTAEAQAARTVAAVNAQTASELSALAQQRLTFTNAITGQTGTLGGIQKLTNGQLNTVADLQGQAVSVSQIIATATRGSERLADATRALLNGGIQITNIGAITDSTRATVTALGQLNTTMRELRREIRIDALRAEYIALSAQRTDANKVAIDAERLKLQVQASILGGGVPQFASGGDFLGGLRIVGEKGPELEATGPSRIYSADQTKAMLSGGPIMAELLAEIKALRDEQRQLGLRADRRGEKTARILNKWDQIGMPPEQVTP